METVEVTWAQYQICNQFPFFFFRRKEGNKFYVKLGWKTEQSKGLFKKILAI